VRNETGKLPHVYFGWSEGNPVSYLLKYIAFGEGDTAPVTHEVLRQAEKDPERRPIVHVGGGVNLVRPTLPELFGATRQHGTNSNRTAAAHLFSNLRRISVSGQAQNY